MNERKKGANASQQSEMKKHRSVVEKSVYGPLGPSLEYICGLLQEENVEEFKNVYRLYLQTNKDLKGINFMTKVVVRCSEAGYEKVEKFLEVMLKEESTLTCDKNADGDTPLMMACEKADCPQLILALVEESPETERLGNLDGDIPVLKCKQNEPPPTTRTSPSEHPIVTKLAKEKQSDFDNLGKFLFDSPDYYNFQKSPAVKIPEPKITEEKISDCIFDSQDSDLPHKSPGKLTQASKNINSQSISNQYPPGKTSVFQAVPGTSKQSSPTKPSTTSRRKQQLGLRNASEVNTPEPSPSPEKRKRGRPLGKTDSPSSSRSASKRNLEEENGTNQPSLSKKLKKIEISNNILSENKSGSSNSEKIPFFFPYKTI